MYKEWSICQWVGGQTSSPPVLSFLCEKLHVDTALAAVALFEPFSPLRLNHRRKDLWRATMTKNNSSDDQVHTFTVVHYTVSCFVSGALASVHTGVV